MFSLMTDRVDALAGVQARLCSIGEVTEDLEGVSGAALVGVNPVLSCRGRQKDKADVCDQNHSPVCLYWKGISEVCRNDSDHHIRTKTWLGSLLWLGDLSYRLWARAGWGAGLGRCVQDCPGCREGNAWSRSPVGVSSEIQRSPPCLHCPSGTQCRWRQTQACQCRSLGAAGWRQLNAWTWDSSGWAEAEWPRLVGPTEQVYILINQLPINCEVQWVSKETVWYLQEVQAVLVHPFLPLDQLLPKHSNERKHSICITASDSSQVNNVLIVLGTNTPKVYSQKNP